MAEYQGTARTEGQAEQVVNNTMTLTDEDTDGLFWHKPLPGSKWCIFNEDGESLCETLEISESEATQPVIPEDEPDPETDCIECCQKAGFDIERQ